MFYIGSVDSSGISALCIYVVQQFFFFIIMQQFNRCVVNLFLQKQHYVIQVYSTIECKKISDFKNSNVDSNLSVNYQTTL
jgi:hypothetical protein